jgi:hypothetical protein
MLDDLRFLISNISSIREIKRVFDYGYSIIRYIQKQEVLPNNFKLLLDQQIVVTNLIERFSKMDAKQGIDAYETLFEEIRYFRKEKTKVLIAQIQTVLDQAGPKPSAKSKTISLGLEKTDNEAKNKLAMIFALRAFDRIITHLTHLIENRLYIRTGNYSVADIVNIDVIKD